VSVTGYYLLWLAVGLALSAALSSAITAHLRMRELRRFQAVQLREALAQYSQWIFSQRHAAFFDAQIQEAGTSFLRELCVLQQHCFPELAKPAREILVVHEGLIAFMRAQDALRRQDAEAWLESDHDARFMELWRQHQAATGCVIAELDAFAVSAPRRQARRPGRTASA
jgi:post-segregation antitoxin (ccd killing protein)